jgi:hypothetical protein
MESLILLNQKFLKCYRYRLQQKKLEVQEAEIRKNRKSRIQQTNHPKTKAKKKMKIQSHFKKWKGRKHQNKKIEKKKWNESNNCKDLNICSAIVDKICKTVRKCFQTSEDIQISF